MRTGFTLVMPRWGGWTSDLAESAEVFGRYYPAYAEQMCAAARAARTPAAYPELLDELLTGLAPWLAAEYLAVHGAKAAGRAASLATEGHLAVARPRPGRQPRPPTRLLRPGRPSPRPVPVSARQPSISPCSPQVVQLRPHRQLGRRPQRPVHVGVDVRRRPRRACGGPASTAVSTWASRCARWAR